jgi:hypothetical protein
MPYDHKADRELVQQTFSREWGEPACVVRVENFVPSFEVPGRQANGSPSSEESRVRRLLHAVYQFLWFVVSLAAGVLGGNLSGPPSFEHYRGHARGPEGSSAVQFAELLRGASFWLVISASWLAAVKTGSSPPIIVVWSAVGPDRPQRDGDPGLLRWPDGSSVFIIFETAERQRLVGV